MFYSNETKYVRVYFKRVWELILAPFAQCITTRDHILLETLVPLRADAKSSTLLCFVCRELLNGLNDPSCMMNIFPTSMVACHIENL